MRYGLKRMRFLCWYLAILLALLAVLPTTAFAYEKVDPNKTATLTINHKVKNKPISGVEFQLYRVAGMTEDAEFPVESAFENAGVSLRTDPTEESWSARAITLESYLIACIAADQPIPATASATTDRNGTATFSNLEVGLYLLVGKTKVLDTEIHTPLATLISLPNLLEDNGWDYSPSIDTKNSSQPRGETEIDLVVIKVWKDTGQEQQRPAEVTVTLYGDGAEYSTVKLHAANSWRHSWENLSSTTTWNLVEKNVPANYTVTAIRDRNAFIVTNTYTEIPPGGRTPNRPTPYTPDQPAPPPPSPDIPPADTPDIPEVPTPDTPPADPPVPDNPSIPKPGSPDLPTLPQTGQLWWPIPVLCIGGLALLFLGAKIKQHGQSGNKTK